jgi:hypothetical protein
MKLLLLLAASTECTHAAATFPPELSTSLSHAGLENPESLTKALGCIELRSLQDIQMLDTSERVEMFASLQAMDVGLGSRAKLRRLAYISSSTVSSRGNGKDPHGIGDQRQLQESECPPKGEDSNGEGDSKEEIDSPSVSGDAIALMLTALLAIGSFIVQAKVAKDTDTMQRDIERAQEENARLEGKAVVQLERVRTQMMDVYRPLVYAVATSMYAMEWMARELDFEWLRLNALDACFIRPSERLYPHLEVLTLYRSPEFHAHALEAQGATMWHKWSPDDLEVLHLASNYGFLYYPILLCLYHSSATSTLIVCAGRRSCLWMTRPNGRSTPTSTLAARYRAGVTWPPSSAPS